MGEPNPVNRLSTSSSALSLMRGVRPDIQPAKTAFQKATGFS
jgi:hypothetical protein